jgi:hypothetical protein
MRDRAAARAEACPQTLSLLEELVDGINFIQLTVSNFQILIFESDRSFKDRRIGNAQPAGIPDSRRL